MRMETTLKTPTHEPMAGSMSLIAGKGSGTRKAPLRILYICSSWPAGKSFGGQLRALQIGRALKQMGTVEIAVISADAANQSARRRTEEEFTVVMAIEPESRPNAGLLEKACWALDPKFLNVHGVQARAVEREKLMALCGEYDLVWVLNSRTPNILNRWKWRNAHLDLDDIPSTYLRGAGLQGESRIARMKAQVQRVAMRRRERLWKERFTTLSVCSEEDRQYLGGGDGIHVIPNGFERNEGEPLRSAAPEFPRIGFIGLCTYEPNRDGVRWFLEHCWPGIRREIPGVRFRLAGEGAEEFRGAPDENVDVLGWIADPATEMATWSATVIPVRFGGGTRVKVVDAFSRKCPVVSTRLGAFGYDVENNREFLLADEPAEFAEACVALIREPAKGFEMAARAHAAFLEKWTWDAIAPRVWAAAEDCLRRSKV